jgi:hypothetical protein
MVSAAAPARAQAYDPNFPVCLQTYGPAGDNIDCNFTTLAQCNASASGRAAQCYTNLFLRARESPRVIGGIAAPTKTCFA